MKPHTKITHWELSRRVEDLIDFREKIVNYVNATRTERTFGKRIDTDESRKMKPEINMAIPRIRNTIQAARINTAIYYREAPVAGGREMNIDLISNVLDLTEFQIPYDSVLGMIDRALGIYSDERTTAKRRTFNPFWWIGKFLGWFAHLPFKALRGAGFSTAKVEESLLGKLITLVTGTIGFAVTLLTLLQLLGLLDETLSLLGLGR